jgi:Lon protease-like protein
MELPLFPLNTVLFPGMPLELHIFEERYKLMIGECIEHQSPFGIVLLEEGRPELDPLGVTPQSKPFLVGCTAQIMQVNALTQGRMNITVVGRERFQIQELYHDKPYLRGSVELYPLAEGTSRSLQPVAFYLQRWVERYLNVLERTGQLHFDASQLPDDPSTISYLAAVLLQGVSMKQKQELLAADSLLAMMFNLCKLYRREVTFLEMLIDPPEIDDSLPFSLN